MTKRVRADTLVIQRRTAQNGKSSVRIEHQPGSTQTGIGALNELFWVSPPVCWSTANVVMLFDRWLETNISFPVWSSVTCRGQSPPQDGVPMRRRLAPPDSTAKTATLL